ncbi:2-oxoglutarate-Fe(II)-dependent oxygenase superfamily protein [Litoreibacter meonggei]|uniref:2-oxoglutarate-Fe(II)-dependent oxygenase superfamily protein n=1 Tax=Litoreibacter meonggei TaxID=1049199 RepID=A0A497X3Z7_9RHOB|nr:2OG-Fe(II) oxygenase [Litoreibacter meonggei]RLJ59074.1 2-oxoglutarate-Fe(II)-dependent oxygenase superfamily protein [Litoreibacter meonggei]
MHTYLDLDKFPLDRPDDPAYADLVARCKSEISKGGMFNLDAFLRPEYALAEAKTHTPKMDTESFNHKRAHNVYFTKSVPGLSDDHPALKLFETSNNTLCNDQLSGSVVEKIYTWAPLRRFLAEVMNKPALYPMDDPLAAFNVMRYEEGQALNWHFDRSEFTVTLLLQAPKEGGLFEYRTDLRTMDDPNYDGVAQLLAGKDPQMQQMNVVPGTLNVFRGVNTPHRVTPVKGDRARMIAVLTYYETPGARFTETEQLGFYGRTA